MIKFYSGNKTNGKLMSFTIRTQLHGNWSAAEFPDSKLAHYQGMRRAIRGA